MRKAKRIKHTVRLLPEVSSDLADFARAKRQSQASVVEASVVQFISQAATGRIEAAVGRRLDRLSLQLDHHGRQIEAIDRRLERLSETVALFVRSWLTTTPPLAESEREAAHASGRERYQGFLDALARRLASGKRLEQDLFGDQSAEKDVEDKERT